MKRFSWSSALILGAIWGFLEGTWFFLVPDVLLSYIAIGSCRRVLVASLGVVLGAMLAACVLYGLLGQNHGSAAIRIQRFWSALPGFRSTMLARASEYLEDQGARGLLLGPGSGLPYRVFVLESYRLGIPLPQILLWTPPARLERILLLPFIVAGVRVALCRAGRTLFPPRIFSRLDRPLVIVLSIYWIAVYGWYWCFFLPRTYGVS
jgi:hypothetical protein